MAYAGRRRPRLLFEIVLVFGEQDTRRRHDKAGGDNHGSGGRKAKHARIETFGKFQCGLDSMVAGWQRIEVRKYALVARRYFPRLTSQMTVSGNRHAVR